MIAGVHLGSILSDDNPIAAHFATPKKPEGGLTIEGAGSVIAVVATDAPLLPGQCKALARRVSMGLARTGTCSGHFSGNIKLSLTMVQSLLCHKSIIIASGDIFLAFSTANEGSLSSDFSGEATDADYETLQFIPWGHMDKFYSAVTYATEEAGTHEAYRCHLIL